MGMPTLDREMKKGSAELLILALIEERARHGYEISKLIESKSDGALSFHVASLYPLLYRLEGRGWIDGRWVEKAGQRRRRYYRLTPEGRRVLAKQRSVWRQFVRALDRELKKGSAELIILSIVESRARHGYEISKLIESKSDGALSFHVASLYPLLYRLEARKWIEGRWVEKAGQRRRRYYRLTAEGRRVLARQRSVWRQFVLALDRVAGISPA